MASYQPVSSSDPTNTINMSNFSSSTVRSSTGSSQQLHLSSWERLRKEARSLEQQIDGKLITYSSSYSPAATQELSSLLQNLERVVEEMRPLATQNNLNISHLYNRHTANLYEYNKEFNKTKVLELIFDKIGLGSRCP